MANFYNKNTRIKIALSLVSVLLINWPFVYIFVVEVNIHLTNILKNDLTKCFKKIFACEVCDRFYFAVTIAGNVQNMKPVQNCTGFIFCKLHAYNSLHASCDLSSADKFCKQFGARSGPTECLS